MSAMSLSSFAWQNLYGCVIQTLDNRVDPFSSHASDFVGEAAL